MSRTKMGWIGGAGGALLAGIAFWAAWEGGSVEARAHDAMAFVGFMTLGLLAVYPGRPPEPWRRQLMAWCAALFVCMLITS